MTDDDIKRLRALAEGPGICDPTAVLGLLDEIERLRGAGSHDAYLTQRRKVGALREQLAAIRAARDEACEIAERLVADIEPVPGGDFGCARARIAQLRAVGGAK
jgi:hypothetical protein